MPSALKNITGRNFRNDLARIDYSWYLEVTHRGLYRHAKHTEYICNVLRKLEVGEINKLMIWLPPRHSKSMTVTEGFPSYFIGKYPERRVIVVSYNQNLAQRFGRANKNKLGEFGQEIFGITISRHNASTTNWGVAGKRGGMISVGVGSGITGEGADLLIIDDPIKNRKEADSITYREMVWNEYRNTLLTRLQPGAPIILIQTRWHEDDLSGRLIEAEPDEWTIIKLPCMAEKNDLLNRQEHEPLWPSFGFDKDWAEKQQKEVGSRAWNALYQQRPAPVGGSILKRHWWKYWVPKGKLSQFKPVAVYMPSNEEHDSGGKVVEVYPVELPERVDLKAQSWDMTFMGNEQGRSYVVGQVWHRDGANFYLRDMVRQKLDFPGTLKAFENLYAKWPDPGPKWVEFAANGPAVMQALRHKISGILPVKPEGNKEARGHAISAEVEAGNVYLPHPALYPWVDDLIEECATAPYGPSDDMFDALTQAINCMSKRRDRGIARAKSIKQRRR